MTTMLSITLSLLLSLIIYSYFITLFLGTLFSMITRSQSVLHTSQESNILTMPTEGNLLKPGQSPTITALRQESATPRRFLKKSVSSVRKLTPHQPRKPSTPLSSTYHDDDDDKENVNPNADRKNETKMAEMEYQEDVLLCREKEIEEMQSFFTEHINSNRNGCLYVSGAPGTGKSAVTSKVVRQLNKPSCSDLLKRSVIIEVNCVSMRRPNDLYGHLLDRLRTLSAHSTTKKVSRCNTPSKKSLQERRDTPRGAAEILSSLEKAMVEVSSANQCLIIVLDELDQLATLHQDVLYRVLSWPSALLEQSAQAHVIIVGIANSLDLTERILPRLPALTSIRPKLMHFAPYTAQQLEVIVSAKMGEMNKNLDSRAIALCARKVAASSGDIRTVIDMVSGSYVLAVLEEGEQASANSPQCTSEAQKSFGTPKRAQLAYREHAASPVSLKHACQSLMTHQESVKTLPLQHLLMLATAWLLKKHRNLKEPSFGQLYDHYKTHVCATLKMPPIQQEEAISVCHMLESRAHLRIKQTCESMRLWKICVRLDDKAIEDALKCQPMASSLCR